MVSTIARFAARSTRGHRNVESWPPAPTIASSIAKHPDSRPGSATSIGPPWRPSSGGDYGSPCVARWRIVICVPRDCEPACRMTRNRGIQHDRRLDAGPCAGFHILGAEMASVRQQIFGLCPSPRTRSSIFFGIGSTWFLSLDLAPRRSPTIGLPVTTAARAL